MEKKSTTSSGSRFRSLKEFLSSTRSLNHQNYESNNIKKPPHSTSNMRSSIRNTKNSISLFNLIAASGGNGASGNGDFERPISMALDDQYGYAYEDRDATPRRLLPNKSVSMYGLAPIDTSSNSESSNLHPSTSTRNLAARLFYNLRSKFRRRRRDRNKIVDSKSTEFGTFFPDEVKTPQQPPALLPFLSDNDANSSKPASARYQLKSANSLDTILDNSVFNKNGAMKTMTESNYQFSVVKDGTTAGTSASSMSKSNNNYVDDADGAQWLAQVGGNGTSDRSSSSSVVATSPRKGALTSSQQIDPVRNNKVVVPVAPLQNASPKPVKCLTKELEDLLHYGWYWGGLSKDEAEVKLKGQPDGAFVVRDSSSDHYLLSLSFNSNGKTLHTRIEYRNGQFCFYMSPDADSFNTVAELIQHCIAYSEVGIFCYSKPRRSNNASMSYPVRLTKPISRFTEVKSLLYQSRLVIRQNVRFDLIPLLPLPSSLIEFVSEQRYI